MLTRKSLKLLLTSICQSVDARKLGRVYSNYHHASSSKHSVSFLLRDSDRCATDFRLLEFHVGGSPTGYIHPEVLCLAKSRFPSDSKVGVLFKEISEVGSSLSSSAFPFRRQRNETSKDTGTIFETLWPESSAAVVRPSTFPSDSNKFKDGECLRSVVKLDVDILGRLWSLEVPDHFDCSARIIVYNLKRKNQLVSSTELTNVPTRNLKALAIDQSGSRAYIGDPGDESIIVVLPERGRWWKIKMTHGPEVPHVFSTDLAISKKNSVLYMTGSNTLDLFSINLEELWHQDASMLKDFPNIMTTWHGTKMGASVGLFCDVKDGLHYFMTSEKASVRWDTRLPLKAESHSILLQNENCPCITDYAMDSQKILWGLVNSDCSITEHFPKSSLKFRTMKIGKFSTS